MEAFAIFAGVLVVCLIMSRFITEQEERELKGKGRKSRGVDQPRDIRHMFVGKDGK